MGPAGGPADGAGVARRIDERFDQHGAQVERADLVEVDPTGRSRDLTRPERPRLRQRTRAAHPLTVPTGLTARPRRGYFL